MNPFGLAALVGLLAVGTDTGRLVLRTAFRATVLAGYTAKESIADLIANAKEGCADVMSEIKSDVDAAKNEAQTKARAKKPHQSTIHDSDSSENYV